MPKLIVTNKANVTESRQPDGGLVITIPIRLHRRSGRKEIVLPPEANERESRTATSSEHEPLLLALIRAYTWTDLIESGQYRNVTELAGAVKFERSYVSRILNLVNLAPDIVEAILDGREPPGLSIVKLRRGIPELWEEQRNILHFGK